MEGLRGATSHPLVLLSVKEGGPAELSAAPGVLPLRVLTTFPDEKEDPVGEGQRTLGATALAG